jgi:UDP-GlcNAc3NAcA epimerase
MRIVSVIGARPQFVKLAVVCRAIEEHPHVSHRIVHTGQHYDDAMSGAFFRELGIPEPSVNLGVGSGSHGEQTAEMIRRLEPVLLSEKPDWVLLYGDTNSTAAAALTAAKLHLRSAHIESGLRSFNRLIPEEVNRIVADHLSDLLFCPTAASMDNLRREGLGDRAMLTGDVTLDALLEHVGRAEAAPNPVTAAWHAGTYALATIHRAENTNDPNRLRAICAALETVAREICPVLLVLHPRTEKILTRIGSQPRNVTTIPAVSYLTMLLLEKRARMILTDSGGVQKEAYFLNVPCITLREQTEWIETLENSCNILVGSSDPERICAAARKALSAGPWTGVYGSGGAAALIARRLIGADHASVADHAGSSSTSPALFAGTASTLV